MSATFTSAPSAHSLRTRWLVEQQQRVEIGERIKELRENSAETNRSIAEYVGVGERSVAAWIAGGGIAYDNAKKVAELFGVDVDWIWRGRIRGATPDPFATASQAVGGELQAKLDELERDMRKVLKNQRQLLAAIAELAEAVGELRAPAQSASRKSKQRSATRG